MGTAVLVVESVGRASLEVDDVTAGIEAAESDVAVPVAVITPVVLAVVAAVDCVSAADDSAVDLPAAVVVFCVAAAVVVVLPATTVLDVAAIAVVENMATAAKPDTSSARFSETRDVCILFIFIAMCESLLTPV